MTRREKLVQLACADIEQDCKACRTLIVQLAKLNDAMSARQTSAVEAANADITSCTNEIAERGERRAKILAALELMPEGKVTPAVMEQLFAQVALAQRPRAKQQWFQLQSLLERCRRLNERNGRLLALQREVFQELQSSPAERNTLYSRPTF